MQIIEIVGTPVNYDRKQSKVRHIIVKNPKIQHKIESKNLLGIRKIAYKGKHHNNS